MKHTEFLRTPLVSRMRRKAARMLWPAAAGPEAGYYVTRYLRDDFGTVGAVGGRAPRQRPIRRPHLLRCWNVCSAPGKRCRPAAAGRIGGVPGRRGVEGDRRRVVPAADRPRSMRATKRRSISCSATSCAGSATSSASRRSFDSEANKRARREQFALYVSRWIDLFGEESLPEARVPRIGNPMGFVIHGNLYTADALRHNFYAHRMADLADDLTDPIVCEVGGGFGGFARHLLSLPGSALQVRRLRPPGRLHRSRVLPDDRAARQATATLRRSRRPRRPAARCRHRDPAELRAAGSPRPERRRLLQHLQLRRDGSRDSAGVQPPVRASLSSVHLVRGPQLDR